MKKRTDEQRVGFMAAGTYSSMMPGFTVNLLVRDIETSLRFYRDVLSATVHYADPDFAALRVCSLEFMLHADHTYDEHPLYERLVIGARRGIGAELRLLGLYPDDVEERARAMGAMILQTTATKGHGLREVMVEDPDGYVWAVGATV